MKAVSAISMSITLLACAGPRLATPEQLAAEEQRILAPFMEEQTVVARSVRVEMTGNFYDEFLTAQVVQPAHRVTHEDGLDGGSTYRYTAIWREPVMMFRIGKTRFAVEEELVLHILGGRHELTLEVEALVVTLAKGEKQSNMRRLHIADGIFSRTDAGR